MLISLGCFGGGWGLLRNPKHGFKNSPVSTNSQTWVKSGDGPTQMGPVWDFVKVFAPGLWLW